MESLLRTHSSSFNRDRIRDDDKRHAEVGVWQIRPDGSSPGAGCLPAGRSRTMMATPLLARGCGPERIVEKARQLVDSSLAGDSPGSGSSALRSFSGSGVSDVGNPRTTVFPADDPSC